MVILNLFLSPVDKNKYSHIPERDLPQKKYVGHARFLSDSLKNNSIALYDYLVKKGIKVIETDIIFSKDNVPILSHDNELFPNFKIKENIACDRNGKLLDTLGGVATLFDLIDFAKENDIFLQLDLEKNILSNEQIHILYKSIENAKMLNQVIWEINDENFENFSALSKELIYQFDNAWNYNRLHNLKRHQKKAKAIYLSQYFQQLPPDTSFKDFFKQAHTNGFLVKVCCISDSNAASKLWDDGVDLIVIDKLIKGP